MQNRNWPLLNSSCFLTLSNKVRPPQTCAAGYPDEYSHFHASSSNFTASFILSSLILAYPSMIVGFQPVRRIDIILRKSIYSNAFFPQLFESILLLSYHRQNAAAYVLRHSPPISYRFSEMFSNSPSAYHDGSCTMSGSGSDAFHNVRPR